jgi:hypothetical protein
MARYVVTVPGTVPWVSYLAPDRKLRKSEVVELTAGEVTALNAAGIQVRAGSTAHDALGESFAVSN